MTAADADLAAEVERLRARLAEVEEERDQAYDQKAAADSILSAISRSPGDVQPVLDTIVESTARLAASEQAQLSLFEHDRVLIVTEWVAGNFDPSYRLNQPGDISTGVMRRSPQLWEAMSAGRAYTFHGGANAIAKENPALAGIWRRLTQRTGLVFGSSVTVPLQSPNGVLGALIVRRVTAEPYTAGQVRVLETFAKQAVIALENANLFSDLREALAQQTATAEILGVIGSSPTDLQPVFAAVAERAQRLLSGEIAGVWLREGDAIQLVAEVGPTSRRALNQASRTALGHDTPSASVVREARTIHVHGTPDTIERDHPRTAAAWRAAGFERRTVLYVPLLHDGAALGVILVGRADGVPFTERQIVLLETFAAQVVIAMQNTRLFTELQTSNAGLTEALEQQTISAEILRVISSSPGDLDTALQAINEAALRRCSAQGARVFMRDGDGFIAGPTVAHAPGLAMAFMPPGTQVTLPFIPEFEAGRTVHLPDYLGWIAEHSPAGLAYLRSTGQRTIAMVPLLRGRDVIGVLALLRFHEISPFSERELAQAELFGGQAVIAIENARLFTELQQSNASLREALGHQQATAEVLNVISRSPADLQPVFDAILESTARLCGTDECAITLLEGDVLKVAAAHGAKTAATMGVVAIPVTGTSVSARAFQSGRTIHVPDMAMAASEFPGSQAYQREFGWRTMLITPLRSGERSIGVLVLTQYEVRPFTAKHIALLETFASQAVIAIENARLFSELQQSNTGLREALEQQTATAEVLRIISRSPTNVQPVVEAIVEAAVQLCGGTDAVVWQLDGEICRATAACGPHYQSLDRAVFVMPLDPGLVGHACIVQRRLLHVPDVSAQRDAYPSSARLADGALNSAQLAAPLLYQGVAIGSINVTRAPAAPFTAQQISLLETFADQAVIAIENTRLFEEIQFKGRELEETNRQLEDATQHKSAFLSAMSHELRTPLNAVIGYSEMLAEEAQDLGEPHFVADLEKINGAGKHLLSLISNVLDLSKIEAGKMDVLLSDFAVAQVLAEVLAVVPPLMEQHGNRFELDTAPDLGTMHSDQTKLRQCLLNLLSNAAKFTEHGTIMLATQRETDPAGDWLVFTVTDTGIGLTDKQQARLFQSFTQAEAGTSSTHGGTGLGLALSREFCRLLGGDVAVESEPGVGSTFTIRLPATVGPAPG